MRAIGCNNQVLVLTVHQWPAPVSVGGLKVNVVMMTMMAMMIM